jgi:regulation of enolase protein 1 (concanavalin A-like superfamily)
MELASEDFVAVNVPTTFEQPDDVREYFSLHAPPNTSIWRKPSSSDDTSAPMVLKRLRQSFILAEVTVSASLSEEFDQAGIVIFAGSLPDPTLSPLPVASRRVSRYSRDGGESRATGRWAKAGLELIEGELHAASVVAISPCGSDWASSARLPPPASPYGPYSFASQSLRVKLERVGDSLWIWYKLAGNSASLEAQAPSSDYYLRPRNPEDVASGWRKMREVMGFFAGGFDLLKGEVWVGCYASRPMEFEPRHSWETPPGLLAEFEDLDIL